RPNYLSSRHFPSESIRNNSVKTAAEQRNISDISATSSIPPALTEKAVVLYLFSQASISRSNAAATAQRLRSRSADSGFRAKQLPDGLACFEPKISELKGIQPVPMGSFG